MPDTVQALCPSWLWILCPLWCFPGYLVAYKTVLCVFFLYIVFFHWSYSGNYFILWLWIYLTDIPFYYICNFSFDLMLTIVITTEMILVQDREQNVCMLATRHHVVSNCVFPVGLNCHHDCVLNVYSHGGAIQTPKRLKSIPSQESSKWLLRFHRQWSLRLKFVQNWLSWAHGNSWGSNHTWSRSPWAQLVGAQVTWNSALNCSKSASLFSPGLELEVPEERTRFSSPSILFRMAFPK